MNLELRPRAVSDLVEIRDYLLEQASEQAAERVRCHLLKRLDGLCRSPANGRRSSHPNIRILSPTTYPYRIYFTVVDQTVVVLHIRHTARRLVDPGGL
jgi:toxin ParE1/3/4